MGSYTGCGEDQVNSYYCVINYITKCYIILHYVTSRYIILHRASFGKVALLCSLPTEVPVSTAAPL